MESEQATGEDNVNVGESGKAVQLERERALALDAHELDEQLADEPSGAYESHQAESVARPSSARGRVFADEREQLVAERLHRPPPLADCRVHANLDFGVVVDFFVANATSSRSHFVQV